MLRRGRCASPVSESVHDRFISSAEDRGGERRFSHRLIVLDTSLHVKLYDPACSVGAFAWHPETALAALIEHAHTR
jgi:hypothetical protein